MTYNEIWDSFKAISYGLNHMGAVVYIDLTKPGFRFFPSTFGNPLVFSGVTGNYTATSTINAAEDIIAKILRQERIKKTDRDFYDLQTWKGYNYKKGQFILSRIHLENTRKLSVRSWEEIKKVPDFFGGLFLCVLGTSDCVNISYQGT